MLTDTEKIQLKSLAKLSERDLKKRSKLMLLVAIFALVIALLDYLYYRDYGIRPPGVVLCILMAALLFWQTFRFRKATRRIQDFQSLAKKL